MHAGLRRHPAALDVQLGDLAVAALEDREQVAREVVLVEIAEAAHDRAVDADVARARRIGDLHEDVPGVHVGVEEAVAEHLREEDLHAALGELLEVDARGIQRRDIGYRDAVDALHHEHVASRVVPVHLGHVEQVRVEEVAPQLRGVGRLALQVELVEHDLLVVAYHLDRAQAPPVGMEALEPVRQRVEQADVLANRALDAGAVLYIIRTLGLSPDETENILYNESGLKGLSGLTNDVKVLSESMDKKAAFALEYFTLKTAQYIAAMATSLGGMDALIFTGGIGENSEKIRIMILRHLSFLPPFEHHIIPANEERAMALEIWENF